MVEHQNKLTNHLTQTEIQLATLFGQIRSWVRTILEAFETRFKAIMIVAMEGYTREFHTHRYSFETQMSARLLKVQVPNFLSLHKEMAILCLEV